MAKYLSRIFALIVSILRNRPLRVRLRSSGEAHFYLLDNLVLPVMAGGAPEDEEKKEEEKKDGDKDADADKEKDAADDEDDEKPGKDDPDRHRLELRRYERKAKKREERLKAEKGDLEKKLSEKEDADKSEREKELDKARKEARDEAVTEGEKERRSDRLEVAATRHASKGVKVGEGEDAETVKFADPEDAVVHIERAIANGDLDAEDIFNDKGKVNAEALTEALVELLEAKPHLRADKGSGGEKKEKPAGDADQGKGKGSDSGKVDMNDLLRRRS